MYIICSMGPRINNINDIDKLVKAGMTTSRFNFSHAQYIRTEKLIKEIKRNYPNIEVMQDLQGNKLRVSNKFIGEKLIKKGDKVVFCLEDLYIKRNKSSKYQLIPINYSGRFEDLLGVKEIFMKDATMHFKILKKDRKFILAEVLNDGIVRGEKGLNMPGIDRSRMPFSKKDRRDIQWAVQKDVDIICASYVARKEDILEVRRCIEKFSNVRGFKYPKVWAKIECKEGIDNFNDILAVSDGIMLGRGDLKAEVPYYMIPIIQEKLLERTKISKKPMIIATYVLESAKNNNIPTIGELSDIYHSIKLGAGGFMLAGEVGTARNPEFAVNTLNHIIREYSI